MKSIFLLALCALLSVGNAQFKIGGSIGASVGIGGSGSRSGSIIPTLPSVPVPSLPFDICSVFTLNPIQVGAEIINGTCQMAKNWLKGIKSIGLEPPQYRTILTPAQRAYWDRVVKCRDIDCLCDYWPKCRALKAANNTTAIAARYGKALRKDIRAMTDVERRRFFYALNKLKHEKIDGWSKMDILTGYHFFIPFTPTAHFSAGLLPFHREQLKTIEIGLRMEHPLATFPMWDSSLDAEMPNPRDSVLWSNELLGNGVGNLTDGPFSTWAGNPNSLFPAPLYEGGIFRAAGLSQKGLLVNKHYVDIIMTKPAMQMLVFCVDPFLDTIHFGVHLYVGGLMADPTSSPGEPLFFLHHGFIDSIWEQWRHKHQDRNQRENNVALPCPYNPFDLPDMQMFPYPIKIRDGYSNIYTDKFYSYQEQPSCANHCHDSKYLVCKPSNGRCMSKVRLGGDCSGSGLAGVTDACYNGRCEGGKCVAA